MINTNPITRYSNTIAKAGRFISTTGSQRIAIDAANGPYDDLILIQDGDDNTPWNPVVRITSITDDEGSLAQGSRIRMSGKFGIGYGIDSEVSSTYSFDNFGIKSKVLDGSNVNTAFYGESTSSSDGTNVGLRLDVANSNTFNYGVQVNMSSDQIKYAYQAVLLGDLSNSYAYTSNKGRSEFNSLGDTYSHFTVYGGGTTSPMFFVDASSNNIGIRNATPSYPLHVLGTVSTTGFRMTNGASSSYLMISDSQGNASWNSPSSVGIASKYSTTIMMTASTPQTITHNLGTQSIQLSVWDEIVGDLVGFSANNRTNNSVDVTVTLNGTYSIVVTG